MSSDAPNPTPSPASGLQSMLARLRGMVQSLKSADAAGQKPEEMPPALDGTATPAAPSAVAGGDLSATAVCVDNAVAPVVEPAADVELPVTTTVEPPPMSPPCEGGDTGGVAPAVEAPDPAEPIAAAGAVASPELCPFCNEPRTGSQPYCDNCGWIFASGAPASPSPAVVEASTTLLNGRYQLGELLGERSGIARYRGSDHGSGASEPVPVVILRAVLPELVEAMPAAEVIPQTTGEATDDGDILPSFDVPMASPVDEMPTATKGVPVVTEEAGWPSIAWERTLLEKARNPALPRVLDTFAEAGFEYLVEEAPAGQVLWDAWDDLDATADQRFGWLQQVAEALQHLHQSGAILEGLRPDIVVVTPAGQAMLADLADLLPLPLPLQPPIRATLYTAPELVLAHTQADARTDLYSFGAMLYALHVGRELTEKDFERQGVPKPFTPFFPDAHPLFARLISKTFCHDPNGRFPTDEAHREDATGFAELIRTLEVCRHTLDRVRLEIAAWTTTGMVRTGNEDAFALLHAMESRQDDLGEHALVLLADGMGGYEAGEVAAALAIQALRKNLLQHKLFAALAGDTPPAPASFDLQTCKQLIHAALRDANKQVHQASRSGLGRRGMGCTAEVVYVDCRHVVVGHVGDSRTYHLHQGRLVQLTRDQTLVNRLVELGQLTPEEAETHPRRSELQQAIGGRIDVEPELYHGTLKPGDWVVVCSDGLSNHIKPDEFKEMLQSEATSAQMAARRLVNLVNLRGATDNATVVVVRAT